jgi:outer membrane protein assembly factor BamD (BamD/ComL family)
MRHELSPPVASPEHLTLASKLAEQNDLFAQGVAARRAGDGTRAVAAFDLLLSRYPSSALAESAMAERMRVLSKASPGAGQRAAKEYLARYSQGFARHDAEAILAQP